jgi:hypothetical protein
MFAHAGSLGYDPGVTEETELWVLNGWPSSVHEDIHNYVLRVLHRFDPLGIVGDQYDFLGADYWNESWDVVPRLFQQRVRSPHEVGRQVWEEVAQLHGGKALSMRDDEIWDAIGEAIWERFAGAFLSVGQRWFRGFADQRAHPASYPVGIETDALPTPSDVV